MDLQFAEGNISVSEYQQLRSTTDWWAVDDEVVGHALQSSLYLVKAYDSDKLVAMGRVVGDGQLYFYIQDVIVHPDYHSKGVGKAIMSKVENYLNTNASQGAFIGLMAAKGVMPFYEQFGYQKRGEDAAGMFRKI